MQLRSVTDILTITGLFLWTSCNTALQMLQYFVVIMAHLHCWRRTPVQTRTQIPVLCRNRDLSLSLCNVKCYALYNVAFGLGVRIRVCTQVGLRQCKGAITVTASPDVGAPCTMHTIPRRFRAALPSGERSMPRCRAMAAETGVTSSSPTPAALPLSFTISATITSIKLS